MVILPIDKGGSVSSLPLSLPTNFNQIYPSAASETLMAKGIRV